VTTISRIVQARIAGGIKNFECRAGMQLLIRPTIIEMTPGAGKPGDGQALL
jgi:hypothetical protein